MSAIEMGREDDAPLTFSPGFTCSDSSFKTSSLSGLYLAENSSN